jgi:hypothetical protein
VWWMTWQAGGDVAGIYWRASQASGDVAGMWWLSWRVCGDVAGMWWMTHPGMRGAGVCRGVAPQVQIESKA